MVHVLIVGFKLLLGKGKKYLRKYGMKKTLWELLGAYAASSPFETSSYSKKLRNPLEME